MKKFIIPISLLIALVLVGGGCFGGKAESFYKKICKVGMSFEKKASDVFGESGYAEGFFNGGFGDDLDDCVKDAVDREEAMYKQCMDKEDDEDECDKSVDGYREFIKSFFTRQGCGLMFTANCTVKGLGEDFNDCVDDVAEVCKTLPK